MEDYIIEVFNKCCEHYGLSKFKRDYPSLCIKHDEEDLLSGEYCAENNEIMINTYYILNDDDVAKTICHEYIHYLQSPTWMKRYNKMYQYYDHPYEVEAFGRESEILNLL